MKRLSFFSVILFFIVALSPGQVLEGVLYLPDSLSGLEIANRLAVVPLNGEVYVGGTETPEGRSGSAVIVFDGLTGEKRARIPLPGGVARMCYVPAESAVYCTGYNSDSVYVFDVTAHRVVGRIAVGTRMRFLAYNCIRNKLYLSGPYSDELVVVDCGTNRVSGRVRLSGRTGPLAYNRPFDQIYCYIAGAAANWIVVIAGADDRVVDSIPLGTIQVSQMVYNPVANKLYCIAEGGDVAIISCWTNQVLRHWVSAATPSALCVNPDLNRVYLGESDANWLLTVLSGDADSIIDTVWGNNHGAVSLGYDPNRNRVYALDDFQHLWALDCSGDSVVAHLTFSGAGESLYFSAEVDRIYTIQADTMGGRDVAVIDPERLTVTRRVPLRLYIEDACYARVSDRFYVSGDVAGSGAGRLVVIDGVDNRVIRSIPVITGARVAYSPVGNKLYAGWDSTLLVFDCSGDSLVGRVSGASVRWLFYNPVVDKLYSGAADGAEIIVVDCARDSVVATLPTPGWAAGVALNPLRNKFYLPRVDASLAVIDGYRDSVIAVLNGDFATEHRCYLPVRDWVVWGKGRSIRAVSGLSNTLDTVVTVNHTIDGMAYNPRRDRLYVSCEGGGVIYVYRGGDLRLMGIVLVSSQPARLLFDTLTDFLYCQHSAGNILTIIDGNSDSVVATVPAGFAPWAPLLNPNRPRFYVPDTSGLGVAVYRLRIPGVAEEKRAVCGIPRQPTIVQNRLFLPGPNHPAGWRLFDATGRKVANLTEGVNDVRALSPGVYFVTGRGGASVRKVVIQR